MKMIKALPFSFLLSLLAIFASANASAATIHGTTAASVVWVDAPSALPTQSDASMSNHYRTFQPPFLVVPTGATVRFPNEDPFYHSIYSTSSADAFDIGYYGPGPGKTVTFSTPGIIDVHCHIHAYMHATIIVANGPYAVVQKGRYSLEKVPTGKLTLHVWDENKGERTQTVDVASESADVTQDVP